MLVGIRNIFITNSVIAVFCAVNFYLPITADGWIEVRSALLITAGIFVFTAIIMLVRFWLVWYFIRVLCYANALVLVLYFISLVGKGYLFSLPVYTLLFVLFGFYFIGVRGYFNSEDVRVVFGVKPDLS